MRLRFRTGIVEPDVLAQRQAEAALQRSLDRGDADLAVALHAVAVAAGKQRARHEHRQIQFGAGAELLVVEVAAHRARDQRGDAAPGGRRRNPHHAKERCERQIEPPWQPADHPLAVERDIQKPRFVEIVGQGAGQRTDQIVAPILPELDVEDVHLQHIAGLGAFDRNGAGQDMAGHHPLAAGVNIGKLGRNMEFAAVRYHVRPAGDGIDRDFVAAGDGQDRLQFRFEKTPVAGFGAGMQVMMGHEELSCLRNCLLFVIAGHSSLPAQTAYTCLRSRQSIIF